MTIKTYIINSMQNTIVDIVEPEPIVHEFTESGTYYKTAGVNTIYILSVGGGGGGCGSNTISGGGYGGKSGEIIKNYYNIIDDSLNIIIGSGGDGSISNSGLPIQADDGGDTLVGDIVISSGGNGAFGRFLQFEPGENGENGYGDIQLATDGESSPYFNDHGVGGIGYGAGGGGSGSKFSTTYYSGGNGAPGYVKIIEIAPLEYEITEPGIYHLVAVDDSNNVLRAYTAPSLKIIDARRAYTETQAEFISDIIFSGQYSTYISWVSHALLLLDDEFRDWTDLDLADLSLSIDINIDDSENISGGPNEIAFWDNSNYSNKLYYELTPILNQLISGEYVNFVIPLSDFTDSNFNSSNVQQLTIVTAVLFDEAAPVKFRNAKLTLPKTPGFVKYNNVAVQNCKVFSILDGEIIDVDYTDAVGKYEIYAPENSIIVSEPTNNTTERPKVVI